MIRKTMRVGDVRTSIKLEPDFWTYLKEIADQRHIRLSTLVNEVANAAPDRTNLASTLRTFSLVHAQLRTQALHRDLDQLTVAGNNQDLLKVMETCPLPIMILNPDREIKQINKALATWLNLDPKATIGRRLDTIMILRAANLKDMWNHLASGSMQRGSFSATYVSPGRVRTAQALAVALSPVAEGQPRGSIILFETLSGKN
ncbi:MAG TPA: ribbon-helix-helix domain-containing protein [Geminicoccus sp.]|jgi:predicted DNA-binding ribbon-helix-helix protein|uniref:ribbon-helix-helix domain-containing protein n=1 Tax=Geminicoccus sp. TaxID=2024832 RepID=UPI002E36677B|nr:ribbon-helix-helix domain-containing protein [Geminicoccus sp.]HEX2525986.1 ribbon-helix-helix domain-containing protein [Geminicoccus sp.]